MGGNREITADVDPICLELRQVRIDQRMDQAALAEELGLESGSSISGYERGKNTPRLDLLHAWAGVFGRRLVLVPNTVDKQPEPKKAADPATVEIRLTPYQVALVASELVNRADNLHNSGRSSRMVKDLDAIVAILDKAVGR